MLTFFAIHSGTASSSRRAGAAIIEAEAADLVESVAVGHAGDIVADGAPEALLRQAGARLGAHDLRMRDVVEEEAAHQARTFVRARGQPCI